MKTKLVACAVACASGFLSHAAFAESGAPVAGWGVTWRQDLRRCAGWMVLGTRVAVEYTRADGQPWDGDGSPPDIVVTLQERENAPAWELAFPKLQDRLEGDATFDKAKPLPTSIDSKDMTIPAVVIVSDADVLKLERVGVVPLTFDMKEPTGPALLVGAGGRVKSVAIVIGLPSLAQCPPEVKAKYGVQHDAARCIGKTSVAKANLRALFTGMKAGYAERDSYPATVKDTGFVPEAGGIYTYSLKLVGDGFVISAMGDPDSDGEPDIWTLNDRNELANTMADCPVLSSF